jgi:hypothetical protein
MRTLLNLISFLWTLPNTILGGLLALIGGTWRDVPYMGWKFGFIAKEGGLWQKWFDKNGKIAITFGRVVIFRSVYYASRVDTILHEFRHVTQYNVLGPFFLPVYGLMSVWSKLTTGVWYENIWLERDAVQHETK